jgi:hypothetical protein
MNTTKVTGGSEEAVSGGRVVVCWVDFVWLYFFLLIKITQNLPFLKKRSEEAVSGVQLHEKGSVDRLAHRGHGFASVGNDAGARDAALIGSIEPTIIKNHKE